MENLQLFFSRFKELGFWQRLFHWKPIRQLSYDAYEEFRALQNQFRQEVERTQSLHNECNALRARQEGLEEQLTLLTNENTRKEFQMLRLSERSDEQLATIRSQGEELARWEEGKEQMTHAYQENIARLNEIKENLEQERSKLVQEKEAEIQEKNSLLRTQWQAHERIVKQSIRSICLEHGISYLEQVPFNGSPDNTVEFSGEYIVFDAKSPATEDLENFPKYIRAQTEALKKYAGQDKVKNELFLVIPGNTLAFIKKYSWNLGNYSVHIIPTEALEPVLLHLKRMDEFEFARDLSPEDREQLFRIIGRFAHTAKRKIQVDQFFAERFLELLRRCETDLPEELRRQVLEFERAEKLNPPAEKRAKEMNLSVLENSYFSIQAEASLRGIQSNNLIQENGSVHPE